MEQPGRNIQIVRVQRMHMEAVWCGWQLHSLDIPFNFVGVSLCGSIFHSSS